MLKGRFICFVGLLAGLGSFVVSVPLVLAACPEDPSSDSKCQHKKAEADVEQSSEDPTTKSGCSKKKEDKAMNDCLRDLNRKCKSDEVLCDVDSDRSSCEWEDAEYIQGIKVDEAECECKCEGYCCKQSKNS